MNKQQYEENNVTEEELKAFLHDFLEIAGRSLVLLLALVIVASAASCLIAWKRYTPSYRASTTFTVYVTNPLQSTVRGYNTSTAEQMAKTFPYILTSSALKDIVRRELKISALPSIEASVLENTNIFTLTVTADAPQLAADVLDVVIRYYPDISEFVVGPTVMSLLDESGVPTEPVNRLDFRKAIVRGAGAGLILWVVWCALLTLLRSTIHSEDELKKVLGLRCLGVLPKVRAKDPTELCPVQGKPNGNPGFTEAVRLARIRTEKEMKEAKVQVLVVCSAVAGEGKTTVALNLASSLASKGSRTLLIDCDLRNPSVAPYLGTENKNGLTELLEGTAKAGAVLHATEQKNLYTIFAGGPSGSAAELLSGSRMKEFIQFCRQNFEYIVLDTSPVMLLSDVSELAANADAALLTVRENYAAKREVRESIQILMDSHLPVIGCVLNRASVGILSSYSGKYGYGKYYGKYQDTASEEP